MTETLPTKLNNEGTSNPYSFKTDESYSEEFVDNNSYIILAILMLIAGFVTLAAFVLASLR